MVRLGLVLLALMALGGCVELRGRKKIQEGNAAYKAGDFPTAAARFDEAARYVPHLPLLWLNRGYACRELIGRGAGAGAAAAANLRARSCALESFKRLRELAPQDPRGDQLYVQTLLDIGDYKTIERTFTLRHEREPRDLEVILVLQQVYAKSGRWHDAWIFYKKGAALRPQDAEAQYAVGTFIWQVLQARGGGPAFAAYDPRLVSRSAAPHSDRPTPSPSPSPRPQARPDDIVGAERVALAEEGIGYLRRAAELRPHYPDALTYIALLYRQQSYALFDDSAAWERAVGQAVALAAGSPEKR